MTTSWFEAVFNAENIPWLTESSETESAAGANCRSNKANSCPLRPREPFNVTQCHLSTTDNKGEIIPSASLSFKIPQTAISRPEVVSLSAVNFADVLVFAILFTRNRQ